MALPTTTQAKIRHASARNLELLAILAQTGGALSALEHHRRLAADLEVDLRSASAHLAHLDSRRRKGLEYHHHRRHRSHDSVVLRLAYRISGKSDQLAERAARDEREWLDALQDEDRARAEQRALEGLLAETHAAAVDAEAQVRRHERAKRELDRLYERIFRGPSPGYPEEDDMERRVDEAGVHYHEARTRAEEGHRATRILMEAQGFVRGAQTAVQQATRAASQRDGRGREAYFGDDAAWDALRQAETQLVTARMLALQARDLMPDGMVKELVWAFERLFPDASIHHLLRHLSWEVDRCAESLETDLTEAQERQVELGRQLQERRAVLEETRIALHWARHAAFERELTAGGCFEP